MGAKKILEKSKLRVNGKSNASPTRSLKKNMAMLLPIFFALAGVIVFVLSVPADISSPSPRKAPRNLSGNFGFMQMAESWSQIDLTMTTMDGSFNLTENLAIIKTYKKFSLGQKKTVEPKTLALNQIIFQAMSVTNPWQAFELDDEIWGFDLDSKKLYNMMSQEISVQVNRPSQNAIFEIEGSRAIKFRPDIIGQSLDIKKANLVIRRSIFENRSEDGLPIVITPPKVKLADTNDLGINELVAAGESDFSGSSRSRITNIRVGAEKFHGVILAPNEEFSFNDNLGPVTAAAGFKPELVIKSTGTVPELGGGLCQVSTTVFRAAFYGGLQITARKNHSYAVSYYSPQGTDATIYPGIVDFKFRNDTSAYLLIATRLDGNKLYFDFYGTKDARQIVVDGPYQYDFTPDGASRARLSRVVTKDNETLTDDFYSRYVSKDKYPVIYEYPEAPKTENASDLENSGATSL